MPGREGEPFLGQRLCVMSGRGPGHPYLDYSNSSLNAYPQPAGYMHSRSCWLDPQHWVWSALMWVWLPWPATSVAAPGVWRCGQ